MTDNILTPEQRIRNLQASNNRLRGQLREAAQGMEHLRNECAVANRRAEALQKELLEKTGSIEAYAPRGHMAF